MNVDTMEAGPELNALVATEVMGWHLDERGLDWCDETGPVAMAIEHHGYEGAWQPSTDIEAALDAVKALEDDDPHEPEVFEFRGPFPGGWWHARIVWRHHDGDIPMVDWLIADSLPLAVCRVVLKRVADDN